MTEKIVAQCSVEGCMENSYSKGMCHPHYDKNRRYGSPLSGWSWKLNKSDEEAFWARVSKSHPNGCWIYEAGTIDYDYGHVRVGEKQWKAHHYSWFLAHGYKSNMILRHSCDTPRCVNPNHLSEGTVADNVQDAVDRGRHVHGIKHGMAKLDENKVRQIRELLKAGMKQADIGEIFGVRQSTIGDINTRHIWKHVT